MDILLAIMPSSIWVAIIVCVGIIASLKCLAEGKFKDIGITVIVVILLIAIFKNPALFDTYGNAVGGKLTNIGTTLNKK